MRKRSLSFNPRSRSLSISVPRSNSPSTRSVVSVLSRNPPSWMLKRSLSGSPDSACTAGATAASSTAAVGTRNRVFGRVWDLEEAAAVIGVFGGCLWEASQGEGSMQPPNVSDGCGLGRFVRRAGAPRHRTSDVQRLRAVGPRSEARAGPLEACCDADPAPEVFHETNFPADA